VSVAQLTVTGATDTFAKMSPSTGASNSPNKHEMGESTAARLSLGQSLWAVLIGAVLIALTEVLLLPSSVLESIGRVRTLFALVPLTIANFFLPVIKTAAVIGSDFRLSELATLAQKQKNDSHLPQILDQLEENQMISQAGPSAESDRHYTFQQTLVREIIYNSLSFEKRRKTHEYLAAYLEQEHRNNLEQYNDLLAYHHEKAGQWQAAGRYTLYSGHKARHRFAYPQAAGIYGRALEMFAKIPGQFKGKEVAALMALAHEGQGDMLLMSNDLTSAAYAYISAANSLTAVKVSDSLDLQIKLALTLPSQQRAKEAETILRRLLNQPLPPLTELAAAATLTWLLWR
jgi:hypothetical protein